MTAYACMLLDVEARTPVAIRVSTTPEGSGSGRKDRIERWFEIVAMVSFMGGGVPSAEAVGKRRVPRKVAQAGASEALGLRSEPHQTGEECADSHE